MTTSPSTAQLTDSVRIPTLPAAVERIRAVLASPDVALADVVEAFRSDPPLAAKVIKTSNSVHYGLRESTMSLPKAISVLGLRTLSLIALRAGVMSLYQDVEEVEGFCVKDIWKHSVFTGLISEDLAVRCRRRGTDLTPQDYYTCGLLHDIGRIVLYDSLGVHYVEAVHGAGDEDAALEAEELRLLGMGHADAGYMATILWKLPEPVPSVIRAHHRPDAKLEVTAVASVVSCADAVANAVAKSPAADPKDLVAQIRTVPAGLKTEQLVEVIGAAVARYAGLGV